MGFSSSSPAERICSTAALVTSAQPSDLPRPSSNRFASVASRRNSGQGAIALLKPLRDEIEGEIRRLDEETD
jgi:hypothetical protein